MKAQNIYPVYESQEESWDRFSRIYELTAAVVDPELVAPVCANNVVESWKRIAKCWAEQGFKMGGVDFMYEAIYHIRYRVFSENVNRENELRLVLLIEDELCRCGYAFYAWNNMQEFESVYRELLIPHKGSRGWRGYCPECLKRYLAGNMANRIMLKDRAPNEWGTQLDCDRATFPYVSYHMLSRMIAYELAMSFLIPESSEWHEEWADGQYVAEYIRKQYKLDVSKDPSAYDAIFRLVELRKYVTYSAYYLYELKNVTPELLNKLWGENAHEMLQLCFLDIYKRYKVAKKKSKRSRYSQQAVMQSWLYQWAEQNRSRLETNLDCKVRDAHFRIALGI